MPIQIIEDLLTIAGEIHRRIYAGLGKSSP
jgi:hypothetical protein